MASMNHDVNFSPLSSPALHPHQTSPHFFGETQSNGYQEDSQSAEAILQRKLALIEQQQQQLLALQQQQQQKMQQSALSPRLQSTNNNTKRGARSNSIKSPYQNGYNGNVKRQATLRQKIAMAGPQLNSSMVSQTDGRSNGGYQTLGNMAHQHSPIQHAASSPMLGSSMPPPLPQSSYSAASPHALLPALSSAPSSPTSLAPATPASLMKLNGGRGSGPNSVSSSPSGNADVGDLGSVDHMPSLPDAILPMALDAPSPHPLSSPSLKPTSNRRRSSTNRKNKKEPFASPAIAPNFGMSPRMSMSDPTIIMSPAALRPQVSQSPRALKPLISPSLKPNWPPTPNSGVVDQEAAAQILASKSNYQNLREGKIASLGMQFSPSIHSGIEIRRTAHKAAEQRRRDTLKKSFDCLRNEIVGSLVNETVQGAEDDSSTDPVPVVEDDLRKEKEKEVKQMSKVVLLQHSFEYIVRLKDDNRLKDSKLDSVTQKLRQLRKQSGLPEVTEEEMEEEREEKAEARRRRIERAERLASSQREEEENNGDTQRRSSTRTNDVEESE
jgi:Helix-loop-helix DNA-binding domain